MIFSPTILEIIGALAVFLAVVSFFIFQSKTDRLKVQITALEEELAKHKELLRITEKRLEILEAQKESKSAVRSATSAPLLKINSSDGLIQKNGKKWLQKAYEHPDTALSILTTVWVIFRKVLRRSAK
jgi:hypothetical protein